MVFYKHRTCPATFNAHSHRIYKGHLIFSLPFVVHEHVSVDGVVTKKRKLSQLFVSKMSAIVLVHESTFVPTQITQYYHY